MSNHSCKQIDQREYQIGELRNGRHFRIVDPDGHELRFARLLTAQER